MLFARIQQSKSWLFQALSSYFIIRYRQTLWVLHLESCSQNQRSFCLRLQLADVCIDMSRRCWQKAFYSLNSLPENAATVVERLVLFAASWYYGWYTSKMPPKDQKGCLRLFLQDLIGWCLDCDGQNELVDAVNCISKASIPISCTWIRPESCPVKWTHSEQIGHDTLMPSNYMVLFNILPSLCITWHHSAQLLNIRSCAGAVQTLRLCLYKSRDRGWIRDPWIAKPGGKDGIPWDTRVSVVLGAGAEVSKTNQQP